MIKSTRLNTACLFHDVNQWDETETRNMCTIYSMFVNAKYNWVIKDFTEDDIKTIAKKQSEIWEFGYNWGAYTEHSNRAFLDYLDSKGIEYTCVSTKDDTKAYNWIERGYAVAVWIKVNTLFADDRKDWKLDLMDYPKYKWDQGHITNFIKWTARGTFENSTDIWKESCLDSYFTKTSIFDCDIKKVLKEIDQPTKFIIY